MNITKYLALGALSLGIGCATVSEPSFKDRCDNPKHNAVVASLDEIPDQISFWHINSIGPLVSYPQTIKFGDLGTESFAVTESFDFQDKFIRRNLKIHEDGRTRDFYEINSNIPLNLDSQGYLFARAAREYPSLLDVDTYSVYANSTLEEILIPIPTADIDEANEVVTRANQGIEDLVPFLSGGLKRAYRLEFVLETDVQKLNTAYRKSAVKKGKIPVFILDSILKVINVSVLTTYRDKAEGSRVELRVYSPHFTFGGAVSSSTVRTYNPTSGRFRIVKKPLTSIVSRMGKTVDESAYIIAIEYLHAEFSDAIYKQRAIALKRKARERPSIEEFENFEGSVRLKLKKRDEVFVHALSAVWLENYHGRGKTTHTAEKAIENDLEAGDPYTGVDTMYEKIKELGVRKAIRLFKTDPDRLFRDIETTDS